MYCSTNTIRSQALRSPARFSGSIPEAFISTVDPSTGACFGGDSPKNCQFGNFSRNALRGPNFAWCDFYITKLFPLAEYAYGLTYGFSTSSTTPISICLSMVLVGIPGKPSTRTGFGALTYTTSPPTGLLGVGLGGDSTPGVAMNALDVNPAAWTSSRLCGVLQLSADLEVRSLSI